MTSTIHDKLRRFVWRIILQQIILVAVLIFIFFLISGRHAALSSLYAGGICVFCNAYFARKVFHTTGASHTRQIMNGIYWGEGVKLVMAGIMFAIVMKYGTIAPIAFFVTLATIQFGYFMSLLLQKSPLRGR